MNPEDVTVGDIVDITEKTGATYRTKVIRIHPSNDENCIEGTLISIRWNGLEKIYDPDMIGDHPFSQIKQIKKVS